MILVQLMVSDIGLELGMASNPQVWGDWSAEQCEWVQKLEKRKDKHKARVEGVQNTRVP
jgi:hypothetical protein